MYKIILTYAEVFFYLILLKMFVGTFPNIQKIFTIYIIWAIVFI